MDRRQDDGRALSAAELDAVSGGGLLRLPAFSAQSLFSSRLDWVALNPQPLPPRWLRMF